LKSWVQLLAVPFVTLNNCQVVITPELFHIFVFCLFAVVVFFCILKDDKFRQTYHKWNVSCFTFYLSYICIVAYYFIVFALFCYGTFSHFCFFTLLHCAIFALLHFFLFFIFALS
jgi:hypothetical protein